MLKSTQPEFRKFFDVFFIASYWKNSPPQNSMKLRFDVFSFRHQVQNAMSAFRENTLSVLNFPEIPGLRLVSSHQNPAYLLYIWGIILPSYNIGTSESLADIIHNYHLSSDHFTLVKLEFMITSTQIKKLRYRII